LINCLINVLGTELTLICSLKTKKQTQEDVVISVLRQSYGYIRKPCYTFTRARETVGAVLSGEPETEKFAWCAHCCVVRAAVTTRSQSGQITENVKRNDQGVVFERDRKKGSDIAAGRSGTRSVVSLRERRRVAGQGRENSKRRRPTRENVNLRQRVPGVVGVFSPSPVPQTAADDDRSETERLNDRKPYIEKYGKINYRSM